MKVSSSTLTTGRSAAAAGDSTSFELTPQYSWDHVEWWANFLRGTRAEAGDKHERPKVSGRSLLQRRRSDARCRRGMRDPRSTPGSQGRGRYGC